MRRAPWQDVQGRSPLADRKLNERVCVSPHAIKKARERIPGVPEHKLVGLIYSEVVRALAAGRTSKSTPRWLAGEGRHRSKAPKSVGVHRFAWPEHQRYGFVLASFRSNDGRRSWTVKTVLDRRTA